MCNFLVLENLPHIIIGLDTLKAHQIILDLNKAVLHFIILINFIHEL